jgi:hypothetical protein
LGGGGGGGGGGGVGRGRSAARTAPETEASVEFVDKDKHGRRLVSKIEFSTDAAPTFEGAKSKLGPRADKMNKRDIQSRQNWIYYYKSCVYQLAMQACLKGIVDAANRLGVDVQTVAEIGDIWANIDMTTMTPEAVRLRADSTRELKSITRQGGEFGPKGFELDLEKRIMKRLNSTYIKDEGSKLNRTKGCVAKAIVAQLGQARKTLFRRCKGRDGHDRIVTKLRAPGQAEREGVERYDRKAKEVAYLRRSFHFPCSDEDESEPEDGDGDEGHKVSSAEHCHLFLGLVDWFFGYSFLTMIKFCFRLAPEKQQPGRISV